MRTTYPAFSGQAPHQADSWRSYPNHHSSSSNQLFDSFTHYEHNTEVPRDEPLLDWSGPTSKQQYCVDPITVHKLDRLNDDEMHDDRKHTEYGDNNSGRSMELDECIGEFITVINQQLETILQNYTTQHNRLIEGLVIECNSFIKLAETSEFSDSSVGPCSFESSPDIQFPHEPKYRDGDTIIDSYGAQFADCKNCNDHCQSEAAADVMLRSNIPPGVVSHKQFDEEAGRNKNATFSPTSNAMATANVFPISKMQEHHSTFQRATTTERNSLPLQCSSSNTLSSQIRDSHHDRQGSKEVSDLWKIDEHTLQDMHKNQKGEIEEAVETFIEQCRGGNLYLAQQHLSNWISGYVGRQVEQLFEHQTRQLLTLLNFQSDDHQISTNRDETPPIEEICHVDQHQSQARSIDTSARRRSMSRQSRHENDTCEETMGDSSPAISLYLEGGFNQSTINLSQRGARGHPVELKCAGCKFQREEKLERHENCVFLSSENDDDKVQILRIHHSQKSSPQGRSATCADTEAFRHTTMLSSVAGGRLQRLYELLRVSDASNKIFQFTIYGHIIFIGCRLHPRMKCRCILFGISSLHHLAVVCIMTSTRAGLGKQSCSIIFAFPLTKEEDNYKCDRSVCKQYDVINFASAGRFNCHCLPAEIELDYDLDNEQLTTRRLTNAKAV